ncbi:MAG: tRNA (N(6)-L-threonylcarbamoyladenosine(37)-C(2))-methylthiotransferase MtaB [Alphaproteobacteria bacterium]|nr:tRNA (N(6)-L-threonylcarbamoyladenosine(37)-C(2))-methylthiotransferase MtaB [Alphaproteobacteria bacterium]
MAKIKTITFGCRFNSYETEITRSILNSLSPVDDVIVINTCSVTHEAERQSKQAVRKAIRENPQAKIIVTGCAAKTSAQYFRDLDGVFAVVQNDAKSDVNSYLSLPHAATAAHFDSDAIVDEDDQLFQNRARAFLQIQNGCDHFCSYCIVPFTRGRARSLPLNVILRRIDHLLSLGFKEIVLSGIDITSYNSDGLDFPGVIQAILAKFPALLRLRISSLDPARIDARLLELLTTEARIMPHFHLSIQSGDNDVLRAMRRRHTREQVIDTCTRILSRRPGVILGADLIAGFPSETDAAFENTLRLIDDAHISLLHVFPYSPRSGTIAAQMLQLPRVTILNRAKMLRKKAVEVKKRLLNSLVGTHISGIVEYNENGFSYGKTDNFLPFLTRATLPPATILSKHEILRVSNGMLELSPTP